MILLAGLCGNVSTRGYRIRVNPCQHFSMEDYELWNFPVTSISILKFLSVFVFNLIQVISQLDYSVFRSVVSMDFWMHMMQVLVPVIYCQFPDAFPVVQSWEIDYQDEGNLIKNKTLRTGKSINKRRGHVDDKKYHY